MARPRKIATKDRSPRSAGTPERSDQVKSLVRALTLLNRLASTDEGASLSEVAQQVGLSPSTAHRLLTTLEQERYVHFDPERRLWSVGMQAFMAGNAFLRTRSLTGAARPHMRALMEESAETVNLAVEDRCEAVYLAQVESRQMMRAFARPGGRAPMHCSGVGKAMLSAMPDAAVGKILQRSGLPRLTANTIGDTVALREDLRRALVEENLHKIELWTARHGIAIADWPAKPTDPFFNVNTPEDAARAEALAAQLPTN